MWRKRLPVWTLMDGNVLSAVCFPLDPHSYGKQGRQWGCFLRGENWDLSPWRGWFVTDHMTSGQQWGMAWEADAPFSHPKHASFRRALKKPKSPSLGRFSRLTEIIPLKPTQVVSAAPPVLASTAQDDKICMSMQSQAYSIFLVSSINFFLLSILRHALRPLSLLGNSVLERV